MIRAVLDSEECAALGITVRSSSPVLALCRKLVDAGHAATPMEVYRGDTLALRIRSIGEAARRQVSSSGRGFEPRTEQRAAPPMRPNAPRDEEA